MKRRAGSRRRRGARLEAPFTASDRPPPRPSPSAEEEDLAGVDGNGERLAFSDAARGAEVDAEAVRFRSRPIEARADLARRGPGIRRGSRRSRADFAPACADDRDVLGPDRGPKLGTALQGGGEELGAEDRPQAREAARGA